MSKRSKKIVTIKCISHFVYVSDLAMCTVYVFIDVVVDS